MFDNKELITEVCASWSWRQRMADKMVLETGTGKEFGGWKKRDSLGLFFPNTVEARDRFRGPLTCCLIISISSNYTACDFHFTS